MELEDLKAVQAAFDRSRGFADLPYGQVSDGNPRPHAVDRMQFALMGLIGEVGEAASLLKKVIRGRVSPGNVELDAPALAEELADVFSYLLKIADAGDIDFDRSYLEKMARNAHRFPSHDQHASPVISVCGPPGSGKTSVVSALINAGRIGYVERYKENPHLGDLQNSRANFDAQASQAWFLDEVSNYISTIQSQEVYLDQDPTSIVLVYSRLLLERGRLSRPAYLSQLRELLKLETGQASQLAARRIVLLDAPAELLAKRCGDKFATEANPAFLEDLRGRFRSVYADLPHVVRVDASGPLDEVVAAITRMSVAVL